MNSESRKITFALTSLAMLGFAANSLLCRAALGASRIDAASFTLIRLLSGALALSLIVRFRRGIRPAPSIPSRTDWISPVALTAYAGLFSAAYTRIDAGIGALILFGTVQVTMVFRSVLEGARPRPLEWCGLLGATAGLANLALPGKNAPNLVGAVLMTIAGVSWGIYSLRGRSNRDPILATCRNFVHGIPLALAAAIPAVAASGISITPRGFLLAAVSGAITSGVIYSIWYSVLPHLRATLAAVVQLSVPMLAVVASHLWLGEALSARLTGCGLFILGGIALVLFSRHRRG